MKPAAGRRETKKQETHAALRDAAFTRFAEKGFAATRVADITEACGVSERTFFRYFESKEHVALAALMQWLDDLFDAIESLPESYGPMEAIGAVFRQAEAGRFAFGAEQARDVIAYTQYPEVQAHFVRVTDVLRRRLIADYARRAGVDEFDPYVRVLGSILSAGLFAIMESFLSGAGGDPWKLARETMVRVAEDVAGASFG
jgi:AcrR family transcriptional regulator